jgi:hypothetical protein
VKGGRGASKNGSFYLVFNTPAFLFFLLKFFAILLLLSNCVVVRLSVYCAEGLCCVVLCRGRNMLD